MFRAEKKHKTNTLHLTPVVSTRGWGACGQGHAALGQATPSSRHTTRQGRFHLAAILGLYSKLIVGWSMASRMSKRLLSEALKMAVGRRHRVPGLVHRSDRGGQYARRDHQRALRSHGMICGMNRKGHCWDNASPWRAGSILGYLAPAHDEVIKMAV
ncbi:MAG: DDE-type integrase/transposase/recombinase [Proteobacteria bacterium]|nr:DDE-type integrase/transposase/recombinase [Pseudomonadota bacterium]